MVVIRAIQLAYPTKIKDDDLPYMVSMWAKQFADTPFKQINDAVIDWIGKSKFLPTVADIKERCMPALEFRNPWYEHFPADGEFTYNDRDMDWVNKLPPEEAHAIWNMLPEEMGKRMRYVPDPNDEERNALLKKATEMEQKLKAKYGKPVAIDTKEISELKEKLKSNDLTNGERANIEYQIDILRNGESKC